MKRLADFPPLYCKCSRVITKTYGSSSAGFKECRDRCRDRSGVLFRAVGSRDIRYRLLHNSVALHHSPLVSAEPRLIEGMRHGVPTRTAGYTALHPRVRIKRDYVSGHLRELALHVIRGGESSVSFAAEKFGSATVNDYLEE